MNALIEDDFTASQDPWGLASAWMAEAGETEPRDANAMALATADADGLPDVRMVLLKGFDQQGFVFYSNTESAKGVELANNPQAAIVLYWKSLNRQIRARGPVSFVSEAEADAYYNSRHPQSRLGAWASAQSRPLGSRAELEERVATFGEKFKDGHIPRPPYWRGYRIKPITLEFWQDRPSRLHDRIVFRFGPDGTWTKQRLNP